MANLTLKFPMAIYKTPAAQISYRELRQVLNRSVTYARTHFEAAREDLHAFSSEASKESMATSKVSIVNQMSQTQLYIRAVQVLGRASQRLYDTLALKRALERFYKVLERVEAIEASNAPGERSERLTAAIDFSMRGQGRPNFLATIALLEWGFRNSLQEYPEFPEAAMLQLSSWPFMSSACINSLDLIKLRDGQFIAAKDLLVGSHLFISPLPNDPPHTPDEMLELGRAAERAAGKKASVKGKARHNLPRK